MEEGKCLQKGMAYRSICDFSLAPLITCWAPLYDKDVYSAVHRMLCIYIEIADEVDKQQRLLTSQETASKSWPALGVGLSIDILLTRQHSTWIIRLCLVDCCSSSSYNKTGTAILF